MNISELLTEDLIIPDMEVQTKDELLEKMVDKAVEAGINIPREVAVKKYIEREKLGSTGIGYGVAVPHVRFEEIDECFIVFARILAGMDFDAIDNQPVQLVFMIMGPASENKQEEYLKIMARISILIRHNNLKEKLLSASDSKEILRLFREAEAQLM